MSLPLRVLGDRVLIRPDVDDNAPRMLTSGIATAVSLAAAITGEDKTTSVWRGTVIAVGTPRHPLHGEAVSLASLIEKYSHYGETETRAHTIRDAAHLLRDLVRKQPSVTVGDDVLFSHDAGQQITIENETFVLMREDELLAIVTPEMETV